MYTANAALRRASTGPDRERSASLPRTPGSALAVPVPRIRPTLIGALSFAAGTLASVKINLGGEVFLAELAVLPVAVLALLTRDGRKVVRSSMFWLLLSAFLVTLAGYVISDLVRQTPEAQYLRGWARNAIVATSFVSLCIIFLSDRRNVWWFLLGIAIGSVVYFKLMQNLPIGSVTHWKFSYSIPFTFLLACSAVVLPLRIVGLLFVALGAYSVFEDYRVHGAVCLLLGGLLWLTVTARGNRISAATVAKFAVAGALGVLVALALVSASESEWHEQRRASSNMTRALGLQVGVNAIIASPIIGYGSWSNHRDLLAVASQTIARYNETAERPWTEGILVNAHSQVLNAWMEGGVFGAGLFLVALVVVAREGYLALLGRPPDLLLPALLFLLVFQLWALVMSPLGTDNRLFLASALAVAVVANSERLARRSAVRESIRRHTAQHLRAPRRQ